MNRESLNHQSPFAVVVNDDPTQLNVLSGLVRKAGLEPRTFTDAAAALAGIIKKTFVAHGYQADTAHTVRAAVDAFAKTPYDVAVLDYHLPDGSGDDLLDTFRALQPDCVCLMMTADTGPELALDWMKRGAAAFLQKPFQLDYLIELCVRARRERAMMRVQDLLEVRTRELRESEARFRNAMDATRDGLWDWDLPSGRVYYSPAYMGMLGYSPVELPCVLNTWIELVHPEDRDRALAANNACVRNETQAVDVEFRMRAKDGSLRWIRGRGHAVRRDAEGQALQMVGTHVDITVHKQAEVEKTELEAQNRQLQKAESLGRMAGAIAHHFNNQLQAVMGNLELAMEELPFTNLWKGLSGNPGGIGI